MERFSIGIDLGGTNLRSAIYTPDGGIQDKRSIRTKIEDGPRAVAEDICRMVADAKAAQPNRSCAGVCVGAPGPLELPIGRFHTPPNLPGWDGFNLSGALQAHLDLPIYIDNDANVAALAECHLGSGKQLGVDSLNMLTLGTGVGHGIIQNGRILHGANGLAGEAGHVAVWPDGEPCNCGNRGCLEMYATAKTFHREASRRAAAGAPGIRALLDRSPEASPSDLYALATAGDVDARAIFAEAGRAVGICIASLINTMNPPLVVVAGGISDAWPLLSPAIFEELESRSYIYRLTKPGSRFAQNTIVQRATLGSDAGLTGAALYPFIHGVSQ
jgi:glucokinase